jgi:Fe-Mn family superoxide dismutase
MNRPSLNQLPQKRQAPGGVSRRQFLGTLAAGSAAVVAAPWVRIGHAAPVTLPDLPYAENALEPVISGRTISFHYGKHHQGYVDKLNTLLQGTDFVDAKLEEIIITTADQPNNTAIFNNAAQVWNHTFYWASLKANGGGKPAGELETKIEESFGGYETMKNEFVDKAVGQFGTGWAWLVEENGKLAIVNTPDAETPIPKGQKPLLTIDVWEHAYYLDYQNRRKDYVNAVIDRLLNWDFAAENLAQP